MNRFEGLREFLAVVDTASFSDAARRLGVSVAHVSRQVAGLETRLGTKLFVRTTRRVNPTAAGEHLALRSKPLYEELERAEDSVLSANESLEGPIRLSMAGHFAEQRIAPMLAKFCVAHPRIQLEVDLSSSKVDLLDGQFDFALRAAPLENSTVLVARRLAEAPMVTLASAPLLHRLETEFGAPLSPIRVPAHFCLSLSKRPWRFRREQQSHVIQPAGGFSSNSAQPLIAAASAGLGLIHIPAYYVPDARRMHRLVPVFDDWATEDPIVFNIVYARNRFMPCRVRLLIEYLQSAAGRISDDGEKLEVAH